MTIGSGIAIAAVWLFAAACGLSDGVTGAGFVIAVAAAIFATVIVS